MHVDKYRCTVLTTSLRTAPLHKPPPLPPPLQPPLPPHHRQRPPQTLQNKTKPRTCIVYTRLRLLFFTGLRVLFFFWSASDFTYNRHRKLWNLLRHCWFCSKRSEVVGWLELESGTGKSPSSECRYLSKQCMVYQILFYVSEYHLRVHVCPIV